VTYHLQSQTPLFKRAIVLSGTSLLIQPLPYEVHEENYKQAIAALGLADASAEDRVQALLEIPGQEIVTKLPHSVRYAPAIDSDIVIPGVTFSAVGSLESKALRGKEWCQELLIGDAEADVCWLLTCVVPSAN
jgi:hypothetical protein